MKMLAYWEDMYVSMAVPLIFQVHAVIKGEEIMSEYKVTQSGSQTCCFDHSGDVPSRSFFPVVVP